MRGPGYLQIIFSAKSTRAQRAISPAIRSSPARFFLTKFYGRPAPARAAAPANSGRQNFFDPFVPETGFTIRWQRLDNGEVKFECWLSECGELALFGAIKPRE